MILLTIFFGILTFICIFITGYFLGEDESGGVILALFMTVCVGFIFMGLFNEESYKQGQVDALTNKIHYHLVTNPDSTSEWEFINKP